MRTSASSAPGTQGSPPRVGWPTRVGRSSSWRRVIASGVASGHTICPTAPPSIAEAFLAPGHDAIHGLAKEVGVSTYKTWTKGDHLLIGGGRPRPLRRLTP